MPGKDVIMLGLPDGVVACLFDLDGVLTDTASVHRRAWGEAFAPRPFSDEDYNAHVDGKPRESGIRDFLTSRGERPGDDEVQQIADRKQRAFEQALDKGITVYDGSRRYLRACAEAGLHRAVVSSSANTERILEMTGLAPLVELRVDGVVAREKHLKGKPSPATFVYAAEQLHVPPALCAVFEDAVAGVAAGHAGLFGTVIGVDRVGHAAELRNSGADTVVQDLEELLRDR